LTKGRWFSTLMYNLLDRFGKLFIKSIRVVSGASKLWL
jgi:hypothetical protein